MSKHYLLRFLEKVHILVFPLYCRVDIIRKTSPVSGNLPRESRSSVVPPRTPLPKRSILQQIFWYLYQFRFWVHIYTSQTFKDWLIGTFLFCNWSRLGSQFVDSFGYPLLLEKCVLRKFLHKEILPVLNIFRIEYKKNHLLYKMAGKSITCKLVKVSNNAKFLDIKPEYI